MKIEFSGGALYVTPNDVHCRLTAGITLRASSELITYFSQGRVLAAQGSGAEWSIVLDSEEHGDLLVEITGCEVR
uniref:DUF3389 family protein n=1 Tax=Thaumasiovibrio occultus TaxID=1891184 RepID=UPI000B356653|nr:DUF3389 family protein [Thaumasiovibrio occultus]